MPGHEGGQFFFVSPNVRPGKTDAAARKTVPDASAATRAVALPLPRAPVSSAPLGKMDVEPVRTLAEPDANYELASVAFNPANPGQLASASALPSFAGSGKIHLWDVTTGRIASTLQRPGEHPEDQFETLAYSPNGAYLAVTTYGMNKHNGVLELWNPQNGSLVRSFGGGSLDLDSESAAFSPDGRMVAVGIGIYPFQVFNTETGAPIKTLPSKGVIAVFAFSPDGSLLAVGSRDWRPPVRLWNTRTWTRFHDIDAPAPSYGEAVAFSPDGKTIATGHYRGGVYLWDVATGALLHTMRYKDTEGGESRSIYFSPDGRFLTFISGGQVQFWSPATGKLLGNFAFGGKSIALHPSGLMLAGATKTAIQIWQLHPTEVKPANSEPGVHK
jgi:WD40 repeat protein